MNTANAPRSTRDLIAAVSSELTPTERRIAEAVLAEPTLLAFGTVSDLAGRVETSRPSVVRFANKLGFKGYSRLQRHVRGNLARHLARPSERIRHDDERALAAKVAIDSAIRSVFETVESDRMHALVEPIAHAENVWILSGETSQAGAYAFRSGLSMVRPGVHLLDEHSMTTDLSGAGPDDAAIVFDFFRYRRQVATATRVLSESGATVVAVTDSPLSPLVELADIWCEIEVPAIGPFDSSVPVVAIAELLVSRVAKELHDEATPRIDRIESLWEETEVFL